MTGVLSWSRDIIPDMLDARMNDSHVFLFRLLNKLSSGVQRIFESREMIEMPCNQCKFRCKSSQTVGIRSIVHTELPSYRSLHVTQERVDGWKCDKCSRHGAVKVTRVNTPARVVCVHL